MFRDWLKKLTASIVFEDGQIVRFKGRVSHFILLNDESLMKEVYGCDDPEKVHALLCGMMPDRVIESEGALPGDS